MRWLSGRKRLTANELCANNAPRVRIPASPPFKKRSCWLILYEGSLAVFRCKIEFIEVPLQPNTAENPEPQETKSSEQVSKVSSIMLKPELTPEATNTDKANAVAPQEDDSKQQSGIRSEEVVESLEQRKKRVDNLWAIYYEEIENNPELMALFDRKQQFNSQRKINDTLREYGYPERTKVSELGLDDWAKKYPLNPKFIKDRFVYLLRGDYPGLGKKGFYTRPYSYVKLTTKQLSQKLRHPSEVGYFLYGKECYLTIPQPFSSSIIEQLAYLQSAKGGSSFISTTTSIPCARAGTGNAPDPDEQRQYVIYVLEIPVDYAISSITGDHFGLNECEVLVPDYILPDEIIAEFPRDNTEEVYEYLHDLLGVTRKDLEIHEEVE